MSATEEFSQDCLRIDPAATAADIESAIREIVFGKLKRKGAVVAISGGVDSSVVAALCSRALGNQHVLGLMLPEAGSSPDSLRLAHLQASRIGIRTQVEDITPILTAAGCYQRCAGAIRKVIPEFHESLKFKIVLPNLLEDVAYPIFSVVVQLADGSQKKSRLTYETYLGLVAAMNFKQRTRKMMEYYYADLLNYAVVGTPNRLEYDQGFFVKNGDGAADLKPIAHLYKSQVYQLAAHLGVPEEIQKRTPTTDTYPLEQSQEEFYFTLSLEKMDFCLYGKNHGISPASLAPVLGLKEAQVERVYAIIESKRRAARYLHAAPMLVKQLDGI
ncbi:MAG: NAD(+) synthase [Terriglobia bacterium]|jgi:NAD+ synthase